jgi:hypothetical protein
MGARMGPGASKPEKSGPYGPGASGPSMMKPKFNQDNQEGNVAMNHHSSQFGGGVSGPGAGPMAPK